MCVCAHVHVCVLFSIEIRTVIRPDVCVRVSVCVCARLCLCLCLCDVIVVCIAFVRALGCKNFNRWGTVEISIIIISYELRVSSFPDRFPHYISTAA